MLTTLMFTALCGRLHYSQGADARRYSPKESRQDEALSRSVDHIQVTVGTVVPAQANVRAGALIVRGVHLQQRRESYEAWLTLSRGTAS
jgi:hypothetical protein